MSKLIIEVRGGNIVGIYGLSQKTRVTVVDWDNWEAGDVLASAHTAYCLPVSKMPEETARLVVSSQTNSVD